MDKIVLITGATGLIGKETIAPLLSRGFNVHAFTIDDTNPDVGVNWIKTNLFDSNEVGRHILELKPSYLLNMAWVTTGDYLTNPINYAFLSASINLVSAFIRNGGRRLVCVGSCLEYKFKDEPIKETDELDCEKNTYVFCKNILHKTAARMCRESKTSFAYGRVFYTFGRNEDPRRLAGSIISKLSQNERVTITGGPLLRDYMYAKDVATALVSLLDSDVQGPVNIATGEVTTIQELSTTLAETCGKCHLLDFRTNVSNQPPIIVANNKRLCQELGFIKTFTIKEAAADIIKNTNVKFATR